MQLTHNLTSTSANDCLRNSISFQFVWSSSATVCSSIFFISGNGVGIYRMNSELHTAHSNLYLYTINKKLHTQIRSTIYMICNYYIIYININKHMRLSIKSENNFTFA